MIVALIAASLPGVAEGQTTCFVCRADFEDGELIFFGCAVSDGSADACQTHCEDDSCTCTPSGDCRQALGPSQLAPDGTVKALWVEGSLALGAEGTHLRKAAAEHVVRGCQGTILSRRYGESEAGAIRLRTSKLTI